MYTRMYHDGRSLFVHFRSIFISVMIMALSACAEHDAGGKAKPVKPETPVHQAADYIKHMALVQLSPEDNHQNIKVINEYLLQKPAKKEPQAVIILEYTAEKNTKAEHSVIVPVTLQGEEDKFPVLLEVMGLINKASYTLHDMHISVIEVKPGKAWALPDNAERAGILLALDTQEKYLLRLGTELPPRETMRMELRLIRFFMRHGFRDAAYIAADNAKKTLALLTQKKSVDSATLQELTLELEKLENTLRKQMPFSL